MGGNPGKGLPCDIGLQAKIPSQGKIGLSCVNFVGKFFEIHDLRCDFQVWCEGCSVSQDGSQTTGGEVREHRKPDILGHGVGIGQPGQRGDLRLGQIKPATPESGGSEPPTRAPEKQRAAQQSLKLCKGDRKRGLADVQDFGCGGHAAMTGDSGGVFQLA